MKNQTSSTSNLKSKKGIGLDRILNILNKNSDLKKFTEDRKGHDIRYSIDTKDYENKSNKDLFDAVNILYDEYDHCQ